MKLKYILIASLIASTTISCDKNFTEINTNPNGLNSVKPKTLLAPALKKVVEYNMSRSQRINNELMQVTVDMGDTDGKIFRYDIRTSESDYLWNNLYVQLNNFSDIYHLAEAEENKSYMAVSLICQAWIFSILTDTYGNIPYFNALKGKSGIVTPEFDSQEEIYKDLFNKLEEANILLKGSANIDATADPIFKGNASLWRKFANSLHLRLLLRASNKSNLNTPAKIKAIVEEKSNDYPLIANNTESAILRWTGVSPYVSPFATWRTGDWNGAKLTTFFVDNLNEWSDPRIQKWGTLYDGEYAGIPSGYPIGSNPIAKSALSLSLMSEPLLGNILNYAELQFILAEASLKGWISNKTPKEYYENGIKNAVELWGLVLPDYYLGGTHIAWDESSSMSRKMEQIHLQKYYSLFFTDLQSWFEYRRTGYPKLPILSGHFNNGNMPSRLVYPIYVQSANGQNYRKALAEQGPDNLNTLVWWQQP